MPFYASFSSDPCSTPAPFFFLFFSFPFGELHSLAISLSLQPLLIRTPTLACHLFLILSTPLHADYNIDSKLLVTVFLSERVSRGGVWGGWCMPSSYSSISPWFGEVRVEAAWEDSREQLIKTSGKAWRGCIQLGRVVYCEEVRGRMCCSIWHW